MHDDAMRRKHTRLVHDTPFFDDTPIEIEKPSLEAQAHRLNRQPLLPGEGHEPRSRPRSERSHRRNL